MTNQPVQYNDRASTNHTSEIEYAAFMHFNAAYLPSGSSPSLDVEPEPLEESASSDPTPVYTRNLVIEHTPILFAF
ncbi:MAG: hypothetical protein R3E79_00660 [Caldilineaceae bacterium]